MSTTIYTVRCVLKRPAEIAEAIKAGNRFRAGSMTGAPAFYGMDTSRQHGQLRPIVYLLPSERIALEHCDYVIFSYATPIAWRNSVNGYWYCPGLGYSNTTSRHQAVAKRVIVQLTGALP